MEDNIQVQMPIRFRVSPTSVQLQNTAQYPEALHGENLLLRELTHRMANDWTTAISTLSMAARRSDSLDVKTVLAHVSRKLFAQAELMRALQISEYSTPVDAAEYLGRLCLAISRSRLDGMNIRLVFAADPLTMDSDRCLRLGMIVSELVANSARHAFRERHDDHGRIIRVDLRHDGGVAGCRISDNGSATPAIRPGHGTAIVRELVASIGGTIEQTFSSNGSVSELHFQTQE